MYYRFSFLSLKNQVTNMGRIMCVMDQLSATTFSTFNAIFVCWRPIMKFLYLAVLGYAWFCWHLLWSKGHLGKGFQDQVLIPWSRFPKKKMLLWRKQTCLFFNWTCLSFWDVQKSMLLAEKEFPLNKISVSEEHNLITGVEKGIGYTYIM